MKFLNHLAVYSFCVAAMVSISLANAPKGWETDVDAALALAAKENKSVMLEFTGSDWCPPCIMMGKKVFSKEEFVKAASKDYVLVHLDFPKKDKELAEKNQPYLDFAFCFVNKSCKYFRRLLQLEQLARLVLFAVKWMPMKQLCRLLYEEV